MGPPTAHPLAAFRSFFISLSSTSRPRMDLASPPCLDRTTPLCQRRLRRRTCQVQLAIREERSVPGVFTAMPTGPYQHLFAAEISRSALLALRRGGARERGCWCPDGFGRLIVFGSILLVLCLLFICVCAVFSPAALYLDSRLGSDAMFGSIAATPGVDFSLTLILGRDLWLPPASATQPPDMRDRSLSDTRRCVPRPRLVPDTASVA